MFEYEHTFIQIKSRREWNF